MGETRRSMDLRFKEHLADLRHDRFNKSTFAAHSYLTSPQMCIDKAEIKVKNNT